MLQGLYVITDGSVGSTLAANVEQALRGGATTVQFRDKTADAVRRKQDAQALRRLCRDYQAVFIINDDLLLAREVRADGVHVGREDAALTTARDYLGKKTLIGVSCYNQLDMAIQAAAQGADYVAFGSFFPSPTKPAAVRATPTLLRDARAVLAIPVCAIGGITLQNAPLLLEHGADMLAVITDVFAADDICLQAQRYQRLFADQRVEGDF